jgi:transposase
MRKISEVLRLRFELGLGQRARVEQALFGERQLVKRLPEQVLPDFPALHAQLPQHRHLTLQLAWEEYRQIHPEGYGYSRFCELYGRWRGKQDVVLRQKHKPGEKGFVDWAGATIPMHDPVTGEIWPASLFVMVLGASSYTYAEATRDQQLAAWINAHMHAFAYFSGVPRLLIPDNLRTGVSRACRYDPDLNPTYQEFAMHYGVGVVPARPYRARDKAKVEVAVQVVERWILAALRHQKFFRLADLNHAPRTLPLPPSRTPPTPIRRRYRRRTPRPRRQFPGPHRAQLRPGQTLRPRRHRPHAPPPSQHPSPTSPNSSSKP